MIVTPGLSQVIVPLQVTGLTPPAMFDGTKYASAEKNVFPARPNEGTVVVGIPPEKVVVAIVAVGSKMTVASPGESVNAELVIDWLMK